MEPDPLDPPTVPALPPVPLPLSPWPEEPAQPDQSPVSGSPLSRLARSRRKLTAVAVVTGVLIAALLGMLALALSSNAQGAQAQNGQIANAGGAQTATAGNNGGAGNGTSSGGSTPTAGGDSSGGDGTHHTPTPTPSHGSATPTPTSGSITGCCLTFAPYVHQVVSQATLSGTSVGPVVATCPSGEFALSGGWSIPAHAGAFVSSSVRASVASWAVYVRHGSLLGVTVYVECLANAPGATVVERTAYVSVSPSSFDFTYPSCHVGEALVGGGFYSQTGLVVYAVGKFSQNRWWAAAKNFGATAGQFGGYAECLSYAHAHSSETAEALTSTVITPGNAGRAVSPSCPSGMYVSGGGFVGPAGVFYDMSAEGSGGNSTWAVYDYNNDNGDDNSYLASQAVCLGF